MRFVLLCPTPDTANTDAEVAAEGYPRNARGKPEFGSVTLTLGHLFKADPFHVKQPMVYSTETAEDALDSLIHYYGDTSLMGLKSTREVLNALSTDPLHYIAVYTVPLHLSMAASIRSNLGGPLTDYGVAVTEGAIKAITSTVPGDGLIMQVVCSTAALHRLTNHPAFGDGSSLVAIDALTGMLSETCSKGVPARLLMCKLEDEPISDASSDPKD